MRIHVYLTFNGCCREAMTWYRDCLGGELFLQEVGAFQSGHGLPDQMKPVILHAMLIRGPLLLFGSDLTDSDKLVRGDSVSLMLECNNELEFRECYSRLAEGGSISYPPQHSVWGGLTGNVTDRYGNHWVLHSPVSEKISNFQETINPQNN
jgi:PhnB protein